LNIDEKTGSHPAIGSAPPPLNGMRILLIDDSPDSHRIVGAVLCDTGASIDSAYSGKEALENVAKENYDLILLDIQMPVLDGYQVKSVLRNHGVLCPIIAFTDRENGKKFQSVSFTDFFPKSQIMDSLVTFLAAHCTRV